MEILGITNKLRTRLSLFRDSNLFKASPNYRFYCRAIEIAINLAELAVENDKKIAERNRIWFEGAYLIDHDFNGQWADISDIYASLVDEINKLNCFENISKVE